MPKQKYLLIFNLVLLLAVFEARASMLSTSRLGECEPPEFRCSNGRCIESRSRCDRKLDCPDGSDEVDCDRQFRPSLIRPTRAVNSTSNDTTQILPSPTQTKRVRNRNIRNKTSNETNDVFDETLQLLEEGDKQIELRQDHRDIVLVTGLPGAGKTTITKFITNPNELEAYANGGRILIRDIVNNSTNATSKVVSKTIFPQLMIHGPSNTAFYDLPGFSDTRNATIEIANAFSMKKVAEHAESVKILLIVSQKSLRVGGSQTDIKTLIEHLTRFVKDIGKFSKGVVLVASKVEDNGKTNDQVIQSIGEFLKEVEKDLDQLFQDPQKLRHARAFLSALVEKDQETGKYKRIGMFKQPQVAGPLMEDPDFESNQNQVQDLFLRKAQFVRTSPGDFGFAVSEDSTLFAKTLATRTRKNAALFTEELVEVIQEELFEYSGNSSGPLQWPLLRKWAIEHGILNQMTNALDEVGNCSHFVQVLNETLSVFSIPEANEVILDLFKFKNRIEFFDTISNDEQDVPPKQWITPFKKLEQKVEKKTRKLAEELNDHVMNITSAIASSLKQQTRTLISTATTKSSSLESPQLNTQSLLSNLTADFSSINRILSQMLTTSTFAQFSNITLNGLQNTHFKIPSSILSSLRGINFDMNFTSGISGWRFPFKLDIWVKDVEIFSLFLQNQIQRLSCQFSEEEKTRGKNEARMKRQLTMLREETRLAAKRTEERQQLAREYQEREESLNASLTPLADTLAKLREQQKQELQADNRRRQEELGRRKRRMADSLTAQRAQHFTRYGVKCRDPCQNLGTNYYWCWENAGGWDYCSPAYRYTINGRFCYNNCRQDWTNFYWCYTDSDKNWDYCGLVQ